MRFRSLLAALLLALALPVGAADAALPDPEPVVFYAVTRGATVYDKPDGRPYVRLGFREQVYVVGERDGWCHVRTRDGAQGWVRDADLSNVWLRVSKRKQTVYVYRGAELVRSFPADLGHNFFTDKVQRGSATDPDHWRTPEGSFFVVRKNNRSRFHRAFVINYPTAEDAARGLRQGLISQAEHDAIQRAEAEFREPPMSTALGGLIELHGDGTGLRSNWTQGCVAVTNEAIDEIWDWVPVGAPIVIEP